MKKMLNAKKIKSRIFQTLFLLLAVSVVMPYDCRADNNDKKDQIGFERLYRDWHKEIHKIRYSSKTEDYLKLPAFRKIVTLGKKALPFLKEKLKSNEDDFMLAYAVIEIMGWKVDDFGNYISEQELRKRVLKRLKQIE